MKRFVIACMALALAVAAGPAAAKNTGTEGGAPPFVTGQPGGTNVFHCKAIGGQGTVVVQEQKDPDKTVGSCTF